MECPDFCVSNNGTVPFAAVTAAPSQDAGDPFLPSEEIVRRVLIERGVAPSDIHVLPGPVATTYDEATALAVFLCQRPEARVLVVTDSYHTRRSRWIMDRTLADHAWQVTVVGAPVDEFDVNRWWCSEVGFTTITAEYLKLAFYLVSYSRFGWWLAACGCWRSSRHGRCRHETPTPAAGPRHGTLTPLQRDG